MAKRRKKRYSFKPRFFIIIAVFILLIFACVKLITSLINNTDTTASNIIQSSNNITIAIDSGHDSKTDKGAVAPGGVYEYKLNDGVAKALSDELKARGYNIVFTRALNSSEEKTLNERALMVNEAWSDLLVSIHHNTNEDVSVKGFTIIYNSQKTVIYDGQYLKYKGQTYIVTKKDDSYIYYQSDGSEKKLDIKSNEGNYELINLSASSLIAKSKEAANDIYNSMKNLSFISGLTSNIDNVIIDQNLQLMRQTHCAGIMVECGFMTNESELAKLINEDNQKAIAKAIADGIDNYFNIGDNKESN